MSVLCIIAECNPLHRGHTELLERARQIIGADCCIVLMSGSYVQRGAPACIDKYARCEALLDHGADIVFELPLYTALGSAQDFAAGAVALADRLTVVTDLAFGSESADPARLSQTAEGLLEETPDFSAAVRKALSAGASYPEARSLAAAETGLWLPDSPNDILAVEYIRSLMQRSSTIRPHALPRITCTSASALREYYADPDGSRDPSMAPDQTMSDAFKREYGGIPAITADDFSELLYMKLFAADRNGALTGRYPDADDAICARISRLLPGFTSFGEFARQLKTRNYTYTRIARVLMRILLDMTVQEAALFARTDRVPYLRLLGLKNAAAPVLGEIVRRSGLPVVTGSRPSYEALTGDAAAIALMERNAADLYESVLFRKTLGVHPERQCAMQEWTRRFIRR